MTYAVGGLRSRQPFRIERIGHFGYHTPDLPGTIRFLTEDLGLQISDVDDFTKRVPELPKEHATGYFIRCAHDHHTLVIGSQMLVDMREPARKGDLVNQLSWQVGSLKQVVDGVGFLDENAKLRRIGRDAPGSNWHAYAYCPDGYVNEIFYGMEQIGWDGRSKPATMYNRSFHSLPPLPQIPEYQEADDVLARGDSLEGYRYQEARAADFDVDGVRMPQPFKLTRLARVALYVKDPEASLRFYVDVLGLTVTERRDVLGEACIFLRAGNEHHSLALLPTTLKEKLGVGAVCSFAVASYQQLRDARAHLVARGVRTLDLPAELSPGISYGFWVQGPDAVAVQIVYGTERHGVGPSLPASHWPDVIDHGGDAWHEPVFMGPLA
ncbi:MAG TPA: VOC family protein [Sphingomonas sp.]|nr:VOC family protein [Sphingomonas sp.]